MMMAVVVGRGRFSGMGFNVFAACTIWNYVLVGQWR